MTKIDALFPEDSQAFIVYHLPEKWDGGTVAKVLKELVGEGRIDSPSWSQVRKWIAHRHIEINGNLCMDEARRVRKGDVLKVWKQPRSRPIRADDIRVVYADEHLCVVEKPPGVSSVRHARESGLSRARRQIHPSLDELLEQVLSEQATAEHSAKTRRPNGIRRLSKSYQHGFRRSVNQVFSVHRLDHHTSGLMVYARSRQVQQKLIAMFRRHQVRREYVGVCHGIVQPQTVRSNLVRDRGDGLRGSLPLRPTPQQTATAREAITHIVGVKALAQNRFTLFRCRLETGRTHQIRIHFSELGHRLCGEAVYVFDSSGNRLEDHSGAPRHALHSDRLSLVHPITAELLEFSIPWPRDLAHWIRSLAD